MKALEKDKVKCRECGWTGLKVELDSVADPRPKINQVADIWCVCPECRIPENIMVLCDEPGCDREVTCGVPTAEDGYRSTCSKHMPPLSTKPVEKRQ